MFLKKKSKRHKEPKIITLQRFQSFFVTTDNIQYQGHIYDWINPDELLCTVPEYIMIGVKSDGYIKDKSDAMYPIQNIISIKWRLLEEKTVLDSFYHIL